MNAARTSMARQWQNIGSNSARKGIPVERVLTGRPAIDALIRAGYDKAQRRLARKGGSVTRS